MLVVLVLVPPLAPAAQRFEWAEAIQFTVLGLVAPGLLVAGAPWQHLGLAAPVSAVAQARRRHTGWIRSAAFAASALACLVAWRTPAAVDRLQRGGVVLAIEAVTLVVAGTLLWLELIASPPLVPRLTGPVRIALCAVSMWIIWASAYMLAMSTDNWYRAYHHIAGHGPSLALDQQLAAAVMWAVAGVCFIPLAFWNLLQWLRSEEDPDRELHRLVREDRRRALPPGRTL